VARTRAVQPGEPGRPSGEGCSHCRDRRPGAPPGRSGHTESQWVTRCFTTAGFSWMIERAAASAGLDLKAHPHSYVMPAATHSPTRGTTPGQSRDGSVIGRSPAPRSTRPWRLEGPSNGRIEFRKRGC